jgi:hypothetical protein
MVLELQNGKMRSVHAECYLLSLILKHFTTELESFLRFISISVNKSMPFQQRKYSLFVTIHGLGAGNGKTRSVHAEKNLLSLI